MGKWFKDSPRLSRSLAQTTWVLITAALTTVPSAQALTLGKMPAGFKPLEQAHKEVNAHPFGLEKLLNSKSRMLFKYGQISFEDAMTSHLRDAIKNPLIEIRNTSTTSGFNLQNGVKSSDFRFFVNGAPFCEYHVRAHELSDRSVLMLGNIPDIDTYETAPSEWPDFNLSWEHIVKSISEESGQSSVVLKQRSKCVVSTNQKLLAVWKVKVEAGGLPYYALADGYETISTEPGYFDIESTAQVYEANRLSGALGPIKLTDLAEDGTLSSKFLKTTVPSSWQKAKSTDNIFSFAPSEEQFDEVQVYANIQRHFDYFKSLGFVWYGPAPIDVRIHIKPQGRANNALFMPGSDADGSLPSISIDDGDGKELRYLISDGDVVSHELGHHVIYKTLRTTSGESLVLHEGLADFFAFARTQDGCLGESICPVGSGACIVEGKCLRTAINNLKYQDEVWKQWAGSRNRLGHLHGQLVSAMLWDLVQSGDVPIAVLPKLVLSAIGYFHQSSGFRDLMLGLFTADKELYGSVYGAKIKAAAEARGLGEFISDVELDKDIPQLLGTTPSDGTPVEDKPVEKKESKGNENPFNKCGSIAGNAGTTGGLVIIILVLLFPLLGQLKKPEPVRVPVKNNNRRKNK
jgi:Zn-dependent metalloprotease